MTSARTKVTINNRLGMHARPAMLFAELACTFQAKITVGHCDSDPVDAKSIMQLMMLAATEGTELIIDAEGEDADKATSDLASLVREGFDE